MAGVFVKFAKWGPHLALFGFIFVVLAWAGANFAFGEFLTSDQRLLLIAPFVLLIGVAYTYQGLFMLLFPGTTLEEDISPPVAAKRAYLKSLMTPSNSLGSRVIGLLGLFTGLITLFFGLYLFAVAL